MSSRACFDVGLETPEEFQEPGSLPLGQALKFLRLLGGAVLMSLNSLLQGTSAAIVEKRIGIRQARSHSPESGSTNLLPGLRRHPFTQDVRPGPDVVHKEIAVWVKSLVPQRLRHSKRPAIDQRASLRCDQLRQMANGAANRLENLESFLDLFAFLLARGEKTGRRRQSAHEVGE